MLIVVLLYFRAAGGELQRVVDEEQRIEEKSVIRYMTQVLKSLTFLHQRGIAHLDIKVC